MLSHATSLVGSTHSGGTEVFDLLNTNDEGLGNSDEDLDDDVAKQPAESTEVQLST